MTGSEAEPAGEGPVFLASAASLDLHGTLIAIFERILKRSSVGVDDDFFDLGGDSILAVQLMVEIDEVTGQELAITVIYDASTVRALAQLIGTGKRPPGDCLVLLRPGSLVAPLFIAHGLGGSAMELRPLARAIDTDRAVYGIEARGLDGNAEPFDRVEDMARFYVEAVRRVQPKGPYLLAGFSFGGLVALEMAQLFSDAHDKIALLVLLDSFPHTKYWPLGSRVVSWWRLAASSGSWTTLRRLAQYHLGVLRTKSSGAAVKYIISRAGRGIALAFDIFRLGAWLQRFAPFPDVGREPAGIADAGASDAIRRVQRAGETAYGRYRPRYYAGEITFIKAETEMRVPFEAQALWRRLANTITVRAVATDHQNLVRAGVAGLASELSFFLRDAVGGTPAQFQQ